MKYSLTYEEHSMEPDDVAAQWCLRISEGPFTAAERAAYRAWLEAEPDNQARFDKAVAIWMAVEGQAQRPDMVRHREVALANYRRARTRRRLPPGLKGWKGVLLAAATLSMGIFLWKAFIPSRYETDVGERRAITLSDGSRVSLDADSVVTVRYSGHGRKLVLERGRASFKVAKERDRPFSVASGGKVVVATGTAFSVERLSNEVQVILYEGHVRVLDQEKGEAHPQLVRIGTDTQPAEAVLTPGKRLILSSAQGAAILTDAPELTPRAWEAGQLEFEDEPLARAVERVNRYATRDRIVVEPDVANVRISGIFNAGDIEVFASEVAATWDVKMSHGNGVITLTRR